MNMKSRDLFAVHPINKISFITAGEGLAKDFLAYVAIEDSSGREL